MSIVKKIEAVDAYKSQFDTYGTQINSRLNHYAKEEIQAKNRFWGSYIGAEFGEGLIHEGKIYCNNLFELLCCMN